MPRLLPAGRQEKHIEPGHRRVHLTHEQRSRALCADVLNRKLLSERDHAVQRYFQHEYR
jgi:hypothetical protein